ncbi:MAG: DUF748 domain-containing protein [Rhodocyclaceae bacterium]|nr:DUF748 domain-containing protein [Rhodocyclaceae bacterium]
MKPSLSAFKKIALVLVGLIVIGLLFLWQALPRIIQSQAEQFVATQTGHKLVMERPAFNPFQLALHLRKLQLTTPDGQPLLAFDGLLVDISAASITQRALVFDAIRLDGLAATLVELPGGALNWTPFLDALKSKEAEEKKGLPRLDIRSFVLAGGRVDFADRRTENGFATRVEPLDLTLTDLSTLPDDEGKFKIAARTSIGARVDLVGQVDLNPMKLAGTFSLADLPLAELAPYLKQMLPMPVEGVAEMTARYQVSNSGDKIAASVDQIAAKFSGLAAAYDVGDLSVGAVGNVAIKDGRVELTESAATSTNTSSWRYCVGRLELAGWQVELRDRSVAPAAELALENLALQVEGISDDMHAPLPLSLSFDVRSGGHFAGEGRVVPAAPSAEVNFKLTDLALKLVQPYLAAQTTLTLADGKLTTQGRMIYSDRGPNVKGEFAVSNLRLTEPGSGNVLLAWKTFGSRDVTLTQKELNLGELRLNGLDTQLLIDKDKNINFKKVMKPSGEKKAPAPATGAVPPAPTSGAPAGRPSPPPAPTFIVNIDRLRFTKGALDFADHSLLLPFGTRIHNLRGSIAGLSNRPGAVGRIELDGAVDDFGMARAVGQVDLGNPTDALDLRVQFKNVEMTRLTPYTATFAGRKIDSGKLSLDLQYQIKQRQLQGDNQVIMDKLTLGERVESPTAKDLPLDLALALLRDADGRIDLGLPVSGSLDDPEFSYGSLVWKAITNVLTKIATAPFRALGALFGGGGEKIDSIAFEAGAPQLTPPEREKVVRLAEALAKRPGLILAVGGSHADTDRVALQDVQLRRTVLARSGQRVSEKGDPGPVSTQQPKIREALEALYKEHVGASDLAALKAGFRAANPGQLEEGVTGKVMSRLSGLLGEKKTLSEREVAGLKGADFYAVLFGRLRAREVIAETRLQALAQERGAGVIEILKTAGVAAERMQLLPPEKVEHANGEVPLRLSLEPAKTNP